MIQENKKEQKQVGRELKKMREFSSRLDSIIDAANSSQKKLKEVLMRNKLTLLASQLCMLQRNLF